MPKARWHNISDTGGIILTEMSVTKRQILHVVSRIIKYTETEGRAVAPRGLRGGEGGYCYSMQMEFQFGKMK